VRLIFFITLALAIGPAPAWAADDVSRGKFAGECIMAAASSYQLPPAVLVILLNVENGRLGHVSGNKNRTVDIGPMQVNDTWVPKIAAHWRASTEATFLALRDEFCANIDAGAWILRQALDESRGNFWEGVALYHSHTEVHKTDYLRKVLSHALKLQKATSMEMAEADGREGAR
jgi:hypothetical protein